MSISFRLIVVQGTNIGQVVSFTGEELSIGREEGSDLVFPDLEVSRRHARIYKQSDKIHIEDLGSTNGTFVNGVRTANPTPLSAGDRVSIGGAVVLEFEVITSVPGVVPPPPLSAEHATMSAAAIATAIDENNSDLPLSEPEEEIEAADVVEIDQPPTDEGEEMPDAESEQAQEEPLEDSEMPIPPDIAPEESELSFEDIEMEEGAIVSDDKELPDEPIAEKEGLAEPIVEPDKPRKILRERTRRAPASELPSPSKSNWTGWYIGCGCAFLILACILSALLAWYFGDYLVEFLYQLLEASRTAAFIPML